MVGIRVGMVVGITERTTEGSIVGIEEGGGDGT